MTFRPRLRRIALVLVGACAAVRGVAADAPAAGGPAATLAEFPRWIIAADVSRDGQTLVTAGGDSLLYRPGDVVAWKLADGTRLGDFVGHPTAVWAAKLSADGRFLATAGYDGLVRIWDVASRQPKHDLAKHKGWVRAVAFAPDGTRLASAGEDGTVVLWDAVTGADLKSIAAHEGAVTCLAFAPDGATLASGGSDKVVKLWNAADGGEKAKLEGHGDAVWAVAYAPDGRTLASGGADRTLRLWAAADGKPEATLAGHVDWVTSLAFSPDGSRIVSGGMDGSVKLWDATARGEQQGPEPAAPASSVWTVAFSPDASRIFVGTHKGGRFVATPAPHLLPPRPAAPTAPVAAPAEAKPVTLVPREFKSMAGGSAAIAADGTVTVTGPLAKDTYTLKATLPETGRVTAFRLEVLTDDTLPQKGPGRAGNGNFVLSTFAVLAGAPGGADTPTAVRFAAAKADFEQPKYGAAAAIDDNAETGWAIAGGIGMPHEAVFTVAPDAAPSPGAPVTITLDQQYADGQHALGRFRLSVVQEPASAP